MSTYATILVSNRLPISVSKVDGELRYEASSGGLATAMASLEADNKLWIGWPGIDSDELTDADKRDIVKELKKYDCHPVFLTKKQTALYYEGYANDTIWPLFHYFQSLAHYDEEYWLAYNEVNQIFSDAVVGIAAAKAKIWIQDYHLMLLPQLIRDQLPGASIGFFLHIPFPSFEIFRLLPQRKDILSGLLGADLIGFHIYDYGRHFISSCRRLLGETVTNDIVEHNGRRVKVAAFPIGIDYEKFRKQLSVRATKTAKAQLDDSYKGQKLILSVDRLDYSKEIPERLEAFRILLDENPQYIGKIKLLMIAVPSRTEVDAYRQLRNEIEMTVSRINGTYGTIDWAPISYQFQNRPYAEIVALYARADIALVTPIRDGMNLVAKEYVASKKRSQGVLILSEMTGAIDELPEALAINPNNARSTKDAIVTALEMSLEEQLRRLTLMQKRLKASTVQRWGVEFMNELTQIDDMNDHRFRKRLTAPDRRNIVTRYQSAENRMIILDYDGTLKDFVKSPSTRAGAPSLKLRRIIKTLSEQPNTTVAIVSGRPKSALTRWFTGIKVKLVAEHGAWTRYDKRWQEIDNDFARDKKKIKAVMQEYTERTDGAIVEEKDYALVWHYINVEPELAYKRAEELKRELESQFNPDEISIRRGRNIVEAKPVAANKGVVVKELLRRNPSDFVLCAGDDYTDEDMFEALDDDAAAITIKVRGGDTKARHQVESVTELLDILTELSAATPRPLDELKQKLAKPQSWLRRLFSN